MVVLCMTRRDVDYYYDTYNVHYYTYDDHSRYPYHLFSPVLHRLITSSVVSPGGSTTEVCRALFGAIREITV